jgi:hypothetical protein
METAVTKLTHDSVKLRRARYSVYVDGSETAGMCWFREEVNGNGVVRLRKSSGLSLAASHRAVKSHTVGQNGKTQAHTP